MFDNLRTYSKYGKLFCSIEHASINGQEKLYGLVLKKKKGAFVIEDSFDADTIEGLGTQLQKNQSVFLVINNKKILSRSLEGVFEDQEALVFAFPNLKKEDFYFEVYTTKNTSFISICRKDYIDSLLKEYQKNAINIIGFSLGNNIVAQLSSFIEGSQVYSSNSAISFTDGSVKEISPLEEGNIVPYTINGLEINTTHTLPLAGILKYYTGANLGASNFDNIVTDLDTNFKQHRIFELTLKIGLSFVFISLLISYLIFSNYASNINQLKATLELSKVYKSTLLKLSDDVQKKEQLVTNFSSVSSKASWYLDQIGKTIPATVLLSEIQFQPLEKQLKEDEKALIKRKSILIKGKTSNTNDFSRWLKSLELQNWIDKVTIKKYGTGKKITTEFELEIKMIS